MRSIVTSIALAVLPLASAAVPLGTAFTYQGELRTASGPATGLFDFEVCIAAQQSGGATCLPIFEDQPVEDGLFTLELNFDPFEFQGEERFLELRVRDGAAVTLPVPLLPRQRIAPTPYALQATRLVDGAVAFATLANDSVSSPKISDGGVANIDLAPNAVDTTKILDGAVQAADISGSAVGLNALAANSVNSGRIVDASVASVDLATNAVGSSTQILDGVVALADLGPDSVNSAKIVDASIVAADIAPGAIGATQVNSSEIQARITGTCPAGEVMRGIQADGSFVCEPLPGITRINPVDDPAGTDPATGALSSVAFPADGLPVIAYTRDASGAGDGLIVVKCGNSACSSGNTITTVDTASVPNQIEIGIAGDGLPVVAFSNGVTVRYAHCSNASCTSSTKVTIQAAGLGTNVGLSLAIGSDGFPVMSWGVVSFNALRFARCPNFDCSGTITPLNLDAPLAFSNLSSTSILIGNDDLPFIVYSETTNNNTRTVHCSLPDCSNIAGNLINPDVVPAGFAQNIDAVVSPNGRPAFVFRLPATSLFFAECNLADCSSGTTIVTLPITGSDARLRFSPGALPVFSYRDTALGALRLLRCGDTDCAAGNMTTTLDATPASSGDGASLAIGSDGLPFIAYHRTTSAGLYAAKCGTLSCQ